jgi:XTP/dITP diphosphohydrolase
VIVLATHNPGKVIELRALLPGVDVVAFDEEIEETGTTFEENARIKAIAAHAKTGMPSLADDSGLEVDALGGRPGVHSARFAGSVAQNNAKLVELLRPLPPPYTARFRCVLVLAPQMIITQGTCEGEIVLEPRGTNGFGYDPHFFLRDLGKTMAELSREEKNARSHRGMAIRAILPHLPIRSK